MRWLALALDHGRPFVQLLDLLLRLRRRRQRVQVLQLLLHVLQLGSDVLHKQQQVKFLSIVGLKRDRKEM